MMGWMHDLRLSLPLVVALAAAACAAPVTDDSTTTMVPAAVSTTTATPTATTTNASPSTRAADLPTARTEVAGAVWDGRIVVLGGLDGGGATSAAVEIYDPTTDSWSQGPDLPEPLHHTAVAVLDDRLYVLGGYGARTAQWTPRSDVWSLGPGESEWTTEPPMRTARGAHAAVTAGNTIMVIGGVGEGGGILTTTELFVTGSGWTDGPDLAVGREHLAAAVDGAGLVYAIAGRAGGLGSNHDSVEVYDGSAWAMAPSLQHARGGIGAATLDGRPCVAGGEEEIGTIGSVECLVDGAWVVAGRLDTPRHGLVVVALDGVLHVIGGGPRPALTVSTVHEVVPITPD